MNSAHSRAARSDGNGRHGCLPAICRASCASCDTVVILIKTPKLPFSAIAYALVPDVAPVLLYYPRETAFAHCFRTDELRRHLDG